MSATWWLLALLYLAADWAAAGRNGHHVLHRKPLSPAIAIHELKAKTKLIDEHNTRQDTALDDLAVQLTDLQSQLAQLREQLPSPGQPTAAVCTAAGAPPPSYPSDCSQLPSGTKSGVHLLQPGLDPSQPPIPAFCDMETDGGGGWTVFQRRADIKPRQDFFLGWQAYKDGFGELDLEFWWGLEHLFTMTSRKDRNYVLRIDLEDFEGLKRHAVYQRFRVSSEGDGYRLQALNYTGDAGDSLSVHNGRKFTTIDKDQDKLNNINCAKKNKGAWWYNHCFASNLNGKYLSTNFERTLHGISWNAWKGKSYSLKTVQMKLRPETMPVATRVKEHRGHDTLIQTRITPHPR